MSILYFVQVVDRLLLFSLAHKKKRRNQSLFFSILVIEYHVCIRIALLYVVPEVKTTKNKI